MSEERFRLIRNKIVRASGEEDPNEYDYIGESFVINHRELWPIGNDKCFGFIDSEGEIVLPVEYDMKMQGKEYDPQFWIQKSGSIYLKEEYLVVSKLGLRGLIDECGEIVLRPRWADMDFSNLSGYLLPVAEIDETTHKKVWGFVNIMTDEVAIKPKFEEVRRFVNGIAAVKINGLWGGIDYRGNLVIPAKYLFDFYFDIETRFYIPEDKGFRFVDEDLAIVVEGGTFTDGTSSNVKTIEVSNGEWKIITKKGLEVVKGCTKIKRTGKNVYKVWKLVDGEEKEKIIQIIVKRGYIVIIEDGKYEEAFLDPYGKRYTTNRTRSPFSSYIPWPHGRYMGGGKLYVINHNGDPLKISPLERNEIRQELLKVDD